MIIINGKLVSQNVREQVKEDVRLYEEKHNGRHIKLVVIQVGDNEASSRYVRNKEKACMEVGIVSETHKMPEQTPVDYLKQYIQELNNDVTVNGILVQLPLPKQIESFTENILATISPTKDVDGFSDINIGKLAKGKTDGYVSCTPYGIMKLLNFYNIDPAGKHCVIIGRSNIVGKPMAMLLLNANATVTVCHSKTTNLKDITKQADILISAVGKPNFVTADMVKQDAVVIDVGINSVDGKLCGDVCADVLDVAYKTPVPGGVGPMTIAMLLHNTVRAANAQVAHSKLFDQ